MKAIAPGKLILSGEHAVVYGRPSIAMAIDRSAVAVITPGPAGEDLVSFELADLHQTESYTVRALRAFGDRVRKNYRMFLNGELGIRDVLRKPVDLFEFAFIVMLDGLHLKLAERLDIRLNSNIPIGCGMGSSAATILSVLRGIGHYFRVEFRPDWYYEYSVEAERMQHGHPSGVDSYISLHGGCARFRNGQAEKIPLPRMPLSIVNTGTPSVTTGECVSEVRKKHGSSGIWDEFEETTLAFEAAMNSNDPDAIRAAMQRNHRLLQRIGVVPERVARFIEAIERTGGAAKICGAGAVAGDAAGVVMVSADRLPVELCREHGYELLPVRGEPLGVRIV